MKYLLLILSAIIISLAFTGRECDHVFVAVEQPEVKDNKGIVFSTYPCGKQDGKDLICVKCFHIQKQIVDYGSSSDFHFGVTPYNSDTTWDTLKK